jgi:cation diffusion facilitator CzcD-associated flavoprotein CzcO/acetyl esterase/lipase
MNDPTAPLHLRVAIVGSGFAGIGAAIRLKQEGIDDFLVFERADDVGGVWRDNTYPGCACDVQSHLYSLSFAPNPDWTRSYSPQGEIWEYLRSTARRFGITPHLRLGHDVRAAAWDERARRWRLETSRGLFTADFLVAGVGGLSEPAYPSLPGLDRFAGKAFHSARWDHHHDLRGARVAVIGTGASAIQFVPAIAPTVGKLHLFQRTPPWVLPRRDRALSERQRRLFRAVPATRRATRAAIYALRELMAIAFMHPSVIRRAEKVARRHLERSIPDPVLRAKLTPSYALGCKRVLISDDYYPSLLRDNVEVVTDAISEVRARSIVTSDGREREVDTIIFGTGFKATDPPIAYHVRGREGRTLAEAWGGSPKAHLGTTVAGFPNFFMLQGPNTGLGHTSVIIMIEAQIEHMLDALRHMRARGAATIEPTAEAQAAFVAEVDRKLSGSVWMQGGCASWYVDATGRNSTLWPGFTFDFIRRLERFRPEEFAFDYLSSTNDDARGARRWTPSLVDRAEAGLARTLVALPPSVQLALSGARPIVREGRTLSPEMQLLLAARERIGGGGRLGSVSPGEARRRMHRDAVLHRGAPIPVGAVRDLAMVVEGDGDEARTIALRHYAPDAPAGAPLLLFLHGGGFVVGDLETHDNVCRFLCQKGGMHVLAVDYRLAPEHPFPAAILDARAALRWAQAHAAALGADPGRVAIGGDSAGANLATVVSQLAVAERAPAPVAQLLLYPTCDRVADWPSLATYAEGFMLTREDIRWFHEQYVETAGADSADPRVSPLRARDLAGQPAALVVTAGFDPLRDEGEAYAEALRAAGNRVVLRREERLIHGFANYLALSRPSYEAMLAITAALRDLIDAAARRPLAATTATATATAIPAVGRA